MIENIICVILGFIISNIIFEIKECMRKGWFIGVNIENLLTKYHKLQRHIYNVVQGNRCIGRDDIIDEIELLQQSEEEFAIELEDLQIDLKGGTNEV